MIKEIIMKTKLAVIISSMLVSGVALANNNATTFLTESDFNDVEIYQESSGFWNNGNTANVNLERADDNLGSYNGDGFYITQKSSGFFSGGNNNATIDANDITKTKLIITQEGSNNKASIVTGEGSYYDDDTNISQVGDYNSAEVTLEGVSNYNDTDITVNGSTNVTNVTMADAVHNDTDITVDGDNNKAYVKLEQANYNEVIIDVDGSNNFAAAKVTGGEDNFISIDQDGNGAIAGVAVYWGSDNVINVTQTNGDYSFNTLSYSNNNNITVTQY